MVQTPPPKKTGSLTVAALFGSFPLVLEVVAEAAGVLLE